MGEGVYETAGVLGVNPDPFTMRELSWMLSGRLKYDWVGLTCILVKIDNSAWNRDPKAPWATFERSYPFGDRATKKKVEQAFDATDVEVAKAMWMELRATERLQIAAEKRPGRGYALP